MAVAVQGRCAEGGEYCGTPTGWRRGGRCRRCRTAHNADLRQSRGINAEQRAHFLRLLRAGRDVNQAAASAGVTVAMLAASSVSDGELRAALDGYPEAVQRTARLGDYLAVLTRTGGDVPLAARASAVGSVSALNSYREHDPLFNAAEREVLAWIDQARTRTWSRTPDELLDIAARMLEEDPSTTMTAAARAAGLAGAHSLRAASRRHQRLRAALPPKRQAQSRPSQSKFTPEKDQLLRELWPDRNNSVKDIVRLLGVSRSGLTQRVRELNLPRRMQDFRAGRRGITAPAEPEEKP